MTTSGTAVPTVPQQRSASPTWPAPPSHRARGPLRLRLTPPGTDPWLDGAWWPQTRDLAVELADLVDHFPTESGRIDRATISPPDWSRPPRRVPVARGYVKVGSFPRDDTHELLLSLAGGRILTLLVVPPGCTPDEGDEAMLAGSTVRNRHSGRSLLETVHDSVRTDPEDQWNDDGGTYWEHDVAPSYRVPD